MIKKPHKKPVLCVDFGTKCFTKVFHLKEGKVQKKRRNYDCEKFQMVRHLFNGAIRDEITV